MYTLVVANAEAGSPFQSTSNIVDILKSQKTPYKLVEVKKPSEAAKAVASVSAKEVANIIAFGGDGTVLPIIKAATKKEISVLPLRGGSANGLARNIGVSGDLEANIRSFLSGSFVVHKFPVASVNNEPLLLDLHFGVFSKSIASTPSGVKKWFGEKAYHFYTLKNATKDNKEQYRFSIDKKIIEREAYGCFVLNINVMKVFGVNILPKARPSFVQVMTVNTRNPFALTVWYISKCLTGHPFNKAITSWQGKEVIFHQAPSSMTFDDVEKEPELPLTIKASTQYVNIVIPIIQKTGWRKAWTYLSTEYYRRKDHLRRITTGIQSVRFSQISSHLYIGGQYGPKAIQAFSEQGITGIVSMREYTPKQIEKNKKIEILHLPTKDMTPPTLENLRRGVAFINKHIDEGGSVYVHCRMGEGRGPTMAAAYLISTGMTTEQSLMYLRYFRPFARPNIKQVDTLREFEAELKP